MTEDDDDGLSAHRTVRPYTITGGRTRTARRDLPFEAIVRATPGAHGGASAERGAIISLAAQ